MSKKFGLTGILVVFVFVLQAQNPLKDFRNNDLLKNANISLLIKNLKTGKTICSYRAENSAVPASTMKVVTTATALELFGPDYRFETKLAIDGVITKDSVLNGNLYIVGGGDPTLGSENLGDKDFMPRWVEAIKDAGIKTINGKLIADESNFQTQPINPKWLWEDIGNYYAPGIYGIAYLDNTFKMYFKTGAPGTLAEVLGSDPEIPGLEIDDHLKAANIGYDNGYFYGAPGVNKRSIYGEIPAYRDSFDVKGDIPNPALLLAQHFQEKLEEAGCHFSDEQPEVVKTDTAKLTEIYTWFSPTLSDIITETNHESNNFFAEYLLKLIATKAGLPAYTDSALRIIRDFWREKGLPIDQLFQWDGCGLATSDGVSANFLVDLLTYMKQKSPYADAFFASLPVAGESGTMEPILAGTRLQGKVHAKSGTLKNVKCYAGFVNNEHKPLVFAVLVNNPDGSKYEVIKKIEHLLLQVSK